MYDTTLDNFKNLKNPIDLIVVGLGFMGFGFISGVRSVPNVRIPLLISRRPKESAKYLQRNGIPAVVENDIEKIKQNSKNGKISVSSDLNLISEIPADAVFEVTGTVGYGTEAAVKAIKAKKHLITMNPELQATVGTELKILADQYKVVITDVVGDQPGSLTRLISQAKLMGFEVLLAGNMKRYLDLYATQEKMKPWADDKGLAVRQTTSFTDGTKQAIEMTLVGNYYGMDIIQSGMKGPSVETVQEVLRHFNWKSLPKKGIVDYVIGKSLFPGIFIVVKHKDPNQKKYLRYLGLGEGPFYVLFEPYHLCHLEVTQTLAKVLFSNKETINNSDNPGLLTISVAKRDIKKGEVLDGIGGDMVYGAIETIERSKGLLSVGLSFDCVVKKSIKKDEQIKLSSVELPYNMATRLAFPSKQKPFITKEFLIS
ncbi:MAG: hypothetical protein HYW63_05045 [Candidatus Levybacteria bacterium]|nr:hypothetical protein [Candidatus Levybacteria bacterium]